MTEDSQNSLVAEICTMLRFQTESPSAGGKILVLAVYMHWRNWHEDGSIFTEYAQAFKDDLLNLHLANDVKGGMQ